MIDVHQILTTKLVNSMVSCQIMPTRLNLRIMHKQKGERSSKVRQLHCLWRDADLIRSFMSLVQVFFKSIQLLFPNPTNPAPIPAKHAFALPSNSVSAILSQLNNKESVSSVACCTCILFGMIVIIVPPCLEFLPFISASRFNSRCAAPCSCSPSLHRH